jgi:hypothetical protein
MPALPSSSATPRLRLQQPRALWLLLATLLIGVALLAAGPIVQPPHYLPFADGRPMWGLPNAADVLSNLPFLLVGLWGLARWPRLRTGLDASQRLAWGSFAAALVVTALNSALFHWQPGTDTITLDRLPIAWACASLLCAFLAERVHPRWGDARSLAAGWVLAAAATLLWWWQERQGGPGDLRPYLALQLLPMLLIPLGLLLRLARSALHSRTSDAAWWWALGLYALAKAAEVADHALLDATGFVSGHTLKHVIAAGAAGVLVRAAVHAASQAAGQRDA